MSSTLERIKKLEDSMEMVVKKITSPDPMLQMTMNKTIGIEQSVVAMGKTLSAMAEELSDTGTLNSASVMARLRKSEDESARLNVKSLLDENVIEPAEVIDESSLVAITQSILNTETGETSQIASYNLIGMRSPVTSQVWKDSLLGKKVGDTVKGIDGSNEQEILTVLEVYSIVEKDVEGESNEAPKEKRQEEISFDSTSGE